MQKKYDIVGLGESLIDFVPVKGKGAGKLIMEGNTGGGPPNVLAAAAKLGRKTALISRVGNDGFGSFIKDNIEQSGVDISGVVTGTEPTTLAMVTLDKTGERSFSFYRNQTADIMLSEYDVDMDIVENAKILHFSTVSMAAEPSRSATIAAVKHAKQAGVKLAFDPNYRPFLWKNEQDALDAIEEGIRYADFVKLAAEEAELLTGESNPEKAALAVISRYSLQFVAVTMGAEGCVGITPKARVRQPAYDVICVDTTGAGDAFWGATLHQLIKAGLDTELTEKRMISLLSFSNAAGSLATTRFGAVPAMATEEEIIKCVQGKKCIETQ